MYMYLLTMCDGMGAIVGKGGRGPENAPGSTNNPPGTAGMGALLMGIMGMKRGLIIGMGTRS